jgi:membrane-associated protein
MDVLKSVIDFILHIDAHLNEMAASMGPWLYVVLFAIVFCETGLVVTPFLPGDSLLFAVGALSQTDGSPIKVEWIVPSLIVAGVVGDGVNYHCGRYFGARLFNRPDSKFFNRAHLEKAQRFYEKYGGKTIILARFVPIVRTFAPFVAGMGEMTYRKFLIYNVVGAVVWVAGFVGLGCLFGDLPVVKKNFSLVTLGIIGLSVLPILVEWWKARREAAAAAGRPPA